LLREEVTMTKPHRSTPEHWATVERYAQQVSSTDDCLLELRARVEALEAGATCPHVVTSGEGTSYCRLAEQPVAEEPSAPPASSLVERVADAICVTADCGDTSLNWRPEARAAIREVAAWLEGRNVGAGRATARWLLEELDLDR
jgi:hypothetical protein